MADLYETQKSLHSFSRLLCCYSVPPYILSFSLIVFKAFLVICFKQFDYDVPSFGFFMCLVLGIQWASWNCGFIVFIRFGICHQFFYLYPSFSSCPVETQ